MQRKLVASLTIAALLVLVGVLTLFMTQGHNVALQSHYASTLSDYEKAYNTWTSSSIMDYELAVQHDCLRCLTKHEVTTIRVSNSHLTYYTSIGAPGIDQLFYEAKKLLTLDRNCKNPPVPVQWDIRVQFNQQFGYPELLEKSGVGSLECGSSYSYRVLSFTPVGTPSGPPMNTPTAIPR